MIFNIKELPQTPFEKFLTFLGTGKSFKEVYDYYSANNLHKLKGQPAVYCFRSLKGKKYYGKAKDLFDRLHDYITLNKSYVNSDLKDDIMFEGQSYFTYHIITTFHNEKITEKNLDDAENFYIANGGDYLYNLTNKKLKITARTAKAAKNQSKNYKKVTKATGFDGFDELTKGGFIL